MGTDACRQQWDNTVYNIKIPTACWRHLDSWVAGAIYQWQEAWFRHQELDPWTNTVRMKRDILDPSVARLGESYLAWRLVKLIEDYERVVTGWILWWKNYLARGGVEDPAMEIVDLHTSFNAEMHRATAYFRSPALRTRTHIDHQDAEAIRNIFVVDQYTPPPV
jgi:hypothetical protein